MKTAPVIAAAPATDADGLPFSTLYRDRYHPRIGALAQAEHVFLNGNGLPGRWRGRDRFVVLETGFGLGNNFLATWNAWRSDPQRCERLYFISIERHPLRRDDLARAHAVSGLAALAREVIENWPPLTPNLHRLSFEQGRVQLLLSLGDVAAWLPEIVATVDAFYLDGFAPDRKPEMWQPRVLKALGRLAAPGATAATWTAARAVLDGLTTAGFDVKLAPGIGGKREITLATFAPRFTPRRAPARTAASPASERHALIVGAGLAGCAVAAALAEQGWQSTLLERLAGVAQAASGNPAGLFHGVVNAQDGIHARFGRAAALQAWAAVRDAVEHFGVAGQLAGLLRLEHRYDANEMRSQLAALGLPAEYVEALDADAATALSGLRLQQPAWLYPGGGWVQPAGLAASFMQRAGDRARLRPYVDVAALRREGGHWQLLDASGAVVAQCGVVVLANAFDAVRLLELPSGSVQSRRGQASMLPSATPGLHLPRLPVAGAGYLLPPLPGGIALFGATSQTGDLDPEVRMSDHRINLAQLARLTGQAPLELDLQGRVGWRCTAIDRLPLIGAVPDAQGLQSAGLRLDQPRFVPRAPGLYVYTALASRGITWAALGARTLASVITGAPCPLEASLLDAVDVARFASRAARRA